MFNLSLCALLYGSELRDSSKMDDRVGSCGKVGGNCVSVCEVGARVIHVWRRRRGV